jgi:hypothetical protein
VRQHEKLSYINIFDAIVAEVPGFRAEYEEHLADYGEILPHLLMGDLTRFTIRRYREMKLTNLAEAREDVRLTLQLLERAMQIGDERLQELISVSFLENLHQAEEAYGGLRDLLGPALLRELEAHYE